MSIIVRILLVVYVALSIPATWILWRNSSNIESLKNAGLLVAALFPLLYFVGTLIKPENESHFNYYLFVNQKSRKVDWVNRWLSINYLPFSVNNSDVAGVEDCSGDQGLDLPSGIEIVEKGIVWQIARAFGQRWDISIIENEGPGFDSVGYKAGNDDESDGDCVDSAELKRIFSNNKLISNSNLFSNWPNKIYVPRNSIISSSVENTGERSIGISNRFTNVFIKLKD